MSASRVIPTSRLRLENVPEVNAEWSEMAAFALTYDPAEMGGYGGQAADLKNVRQEATTAELRAHLYVEQRRWNHYGTPPDEETMTRLKKIIGLIRGRL